MIPATLVSRVHTNSLMPFCKQAPFFWMLNTPGQTATKKFKAKHKLLTIGSFQLQSFYAVELHSCRPLAWEIEHHSSGTQWSFRPRKQTQDYIAGELLRCFHILVTMIPETSAYVGG